MSHPAATSAPPPTLPTSHVRERLRLVIDPELGVSIVDLGLVYGIEVTDERVLVRMTVTTPACPLGSYLLDAVHTVLREHVEARDICVELVWDPPWHPEMMSEEARTQLGWGR